MRQLEDRDVTALGKFVDIFDGCYIDKRFNISFSLRWVAEQCSLQTTAGQSNVARDVICNEISDLINENCCENHLRLPALFSPASTSERCDVIVLPALPPTEQLFLSFLR